MHDDAVQFTLTLAPRSFLGAMYCNVVLEKTQALNTLSSLILCLTSMLSALRVFGSNRAVYWREAASGVDRLSYFLAENVAQLWIYLIAAPIVYLAVFYPLTSPRAEFVSYYWIIMMTVFAASGMGYLISVLVAPKSSQMAAVVVSLITSMLSGANPTLPDLDQIKVLGPVMYSLSISRWMLEGLFEIEANTYPIVLLPQVFTMKLGFGYSLDNQYMVCIGVLLAFGLITRLLAFLGLIFRNRGQQQ